MAFGLFPSAFDSIFSDELYQPLSVPLTCRTAYYTQRRPSYAAFPAVVLRQPAPPKPSLRVTEDEGGAMVITATLPGYPEEGIRVQVERGVLTLSAHPAPRCNCCECNPFALPPLSKSFRLGPHIDTSAVTARFHDGVLAVRLPRKVQPRRIVIASAAAACPMAPMYCAPPPSWVPSRQACFAQPAAACVAMPPAPPSPAPKPAALAPQASTYRSSPSKPRQQGKWVRINVEGPSTSTAPSTSAPPASHPPAPAAVPVAVAATCQPSSQQQQQQQQQQAVRPAVARLESAPIEPLLVSVDPAELPATEAPTAEASPAEPEVPAAEQAAVDKGKQRMDPAREVEFIKAQAEAKRIQAHLCGEYVSSDEEEDGSIEDCEF